MHRILIIDDDKQTASLLEKYLKSQGYEIVVAYSGNMAIKKLNKEYFDIALCEFNLPDSDGLKILTWIRKNSPATSLIIMTAYANVRVAVNMIKAGAFDYVTKPVHPEEILKLIQKALNRNNIPYDSENFTDRFIAGKSSKTQKVLSHVEAVAPTDIPVLIEGETGSGKEFIARAIHYASKRARNAFVAVDCGALPKDLANSELFGHVKGAFTGALYDKKGYFETAKGGTLFLDEISNLPYENQAKILRALQEKVINRVGENRNIQVDVRIIVASNEDLMEEVAEGNFREDLYHRINGFKLNIPALRERQEDILDFADTFLKRANRDFNKNIKGFTDEVKQIFLKYPWYGNIRELENIIKRSALLTGGQLITDETLPDEIRTYIPETINSEYGYPEEEMKEEILPLSEALKDIEKETIRNALLKSKFNKSMAAKLLDIDRKTLYKKIRDYKIMTP